MLNADELEGMRTTATSSLTDTAILQTQTTTSDGGGGNTTAWTASGTVECRIAPVGGSGASEGETGDRISAYADFVVTLPYNASVTTNTRILTNGGTFNVEGIREISNNITRRVEVVKEV